MLAVWKLSISSLPKVQSGTSSYFQFLSLMQVISLLPDKLYPEIQSTSTSVPWSTGSDITVFRPKLRLSDRAVHFSEKEPPRQICEILCFSVLGKLCKFLKIRAITSIIWNFVFRWLNFFLDQHHVTCIQLSKLDHSSHTTSKMSVITKSIDVLQFDECIAVGYKTLR